MTREEAIEVLENASIEPTWGGSFRATREALTMAIEALKRERTDEWCTDCKEYDMEKKCCPRFNRVIRGAMKREPSEDLISRTEAIEAIELVDWYHQNRNKDMVHGANDDEHQAWYKADDVYKALEAVPSADRPKDGDLISRQAAIDALYDKGSSMTAWGELLAMKWSDIQKCIEQLPPADRPRGEWIHTPNGIDRDFVWWVCSECGHKIFSETEKDRIEFHAYCGRCGADMRGENK